MQNAAPNKLALLRAATTPASSLRAELHGKDAPAPKDCPLQGLEVRRVELPPRLARELVEPNAVHRGDHQAPALDHDPRGG